MSEDIRNQERPATPIATAQHASRSGRLKIFLGAAPGVGKTYEMLTSARQRCKEGIDVVVGVVETHGRAETQALLEGLEVVPRRLSSYKDRPVDEMDLDAILARRPQLVLVDELAHTNAPDSRHPKRYLDVEELIGAGIDVYSTLNIQHVESLNTVVAQITRIRVRETVPDSILDRADDIEAIDLAPEDLIQRLREGKVYLPKQAERALGNFFSPGNLTALRELTLRRTAQRVDEQLLSHMQAHAIRGPWAAGERIIVCIDESPQGDALVRYAKRVADRLRASWTALHVETARRLQMSESARDRISETLRLAERLGAEAVTIPGDHRHIAEDVIAFARTNNVTQIIIGKAARSRLFELLNGSVAYDLVRRSGNISVHVMSGEGGATSGEPAPRTTPREPIALSPYLFALLIIGAALGVAEAIEPVFGVNNVDLVFLTAIVGVAVTCGLYPSLVAVVTASLCYNFFFLPPLYTLTIADPTNVAALFFFTVVAVLVSNLAARTRAQAKVSQARARITEALYSFSRKLAGCVGVDDVLWASAFQIASMLQVRVVMLLPEADGLAVKAGYPPEDELDSSDLAAANWAWTNNRVAGRGSDTLPGGKRLFAPMRTARGPIGVVGLDADKTGPLFSPEQRRLLDALLDQAALAIERVNLVEDLDRARLVVETDRLRSSLLTSISHDLKTPLAAILGSASTLRDFHADLEDDSRRELLKAIIDESERLNRFIANLLDMTRLESGAVMPNLVLCDVSEIVDAALNRAAKILGRHRIDTRLAEGLPMLALDPVLFEQILFNLLDNAAKYAAAETTISVQSWRDANDVYLQVLDEGDGIKRDDLDLIFEKFYRARKGDSVRAGTGLGLAISRGFVEAMGGTIEAGNRSDRAGAVFTLRLPVPTSSTLINTAA